MKFADKISALKKDVKTLFESLPSDPPALRAPSPPPMGDATPVSPSPRPVTSMGNRGAVSTPPDNKNLESKMMGVVQAVDNFFTTGKGGNINLSAAAQADMRLCTGAQLLQQDRSQRATIHDIAITQNGNLRCQYCYLVLPSKGSLHQSNWTELGRSHIMSCVSFSDLSPWYMCLPCERSQASRRIFSTARSLTDHLAETHGER